MKRELERLTVHNPCQDGGEVGVFASPVHDRRGKGNTPTAPAQDKKRARLPEVGEESPERGDTLVARGEFLEEQVVALREEVFRLRFLLQNVFRTALEEITHHSGETASNWHSQRP